MRRAAVWSLQRTFLQQVRDYLHAHNYFGLSEDDVTLFEQLETPALNRRGHMLLQEKNSLALCDVVYSVRYSVS